MKKINVLVLLATMVLASMMMAQNPATTPSFDYTPKTDHELLIQIVGELKTMHAEINAGAKQTDDLRKDMNSRFEMQEKIFDRINYSSVAFTLFLFGLIVYDRRNLLKPLEKRIVPLEKDVELLKADKTLATMWEWAKVDPKFAEFMKSKNIL